MASMQNLRNRSMLTPEILTLEKKPLAKLDREEPMPGTIDIKRVAVGIRKGIEFHLNTTAAADPGSDCWFAVNVLYGWTRRDGWPDADVIITNGEDYFLCRRSLGETKLKLTPLVRTAINFAIEEFAKSL